jgi:hypothetical protein
VMNFAEYSFGTSMTAGGDGIIKVGSGQILQRGAPTIIVTGSGASAQYLALFGRRKEFLGAGISYSVQFSTDLQTWFTSNAIPTVVADDGSIEAVTVPAPATLNGKPTGFTRITVTGP